MYIRVSDNTYPLTEYQIRTVNSHISYPSPMPDVVPDHVRVNTIPQPAYDKSVQTILELLPTCVNGVWTQQWVVIDLDADAISLKNNEQASLVRSNRNKLLSECDWTQLADSPVDKSLWGIYRQELRDISAQTDFPFTVIYPIKP